MMTPQTDKLNLSMKNSFFHYLLEKKIFLTKLALALCLYCSQWQEAQCEPNRAGDRKPNFLFVLVDDLPHDALGYHGRYPFLKTPNIDDIFIIITS